MAKRRAEDTVQHESPSKRRYRSLCGIDMQLQSAAPTGDVSLSPPSLLALLGSRCRKRPHYFEEPEKEEPGECLCYTHCDSRRHVGNVLTVQTCGSFQARRSSSALTVHKKRPREDSVGPDTVLTKAVDEVNAETNTEDCIYNSFQYWRVPLPELDLSLLENTNDSSQTKDKSKDKESSDCMES